MLFDTFHEGLLQTQVLAMLHSNLCVLCPAVVLLHHWTVVFHTLQVCISHVHECISVHHVYSVQNKCTVTAMLLSVIAYWTTLCLSTRWVGLMEGALQCWDSHRTCLALCFHMDQLESEASKDPFWNTFVLVFMYIKHAHSLVPCILETPCI